MRFTRWYPLVDAALHAPEAPGMLQLRLATGLVDYPKGKSAMVYYTVAENVRAAATRFASSYSGAPLWCRHLEDEAAAVGLSAFYARLRSEFVRRFGSAPVLETTARIHGH